MTSSIRWPEMEEVVHFTDCHLFARISGNGHQLGQTTLCLPRGQ